jgi:hypothetical protein
MKIELFKDNYYCNDDVEGRIVVSSMEYESEDEMFTHLISTIKTLLNNKEVLTMRMEDSHVLILEHGHDERTDAWGCSTPRWLSPEELETLEFNRENEAREYFKSLAEIIEREEEEEYDCD